MKSDEKSHFQKIRNCAPLEALWGGWSGNSGNAQKKTFFFQLRPSLMLKNLVLKVLLGTGRTWTIKRLPPLPVAANFGKPTHWSCSDILSARTNLSAQLVQVYTIAWFCAPYIPNFVYVLGTNLRFGLEQGDKNMNVVSRYCIIIYVMRILFPQTPFTIFITSTPQ